MKEYFAGTSLKFIVTARDGDNALVALTINTTTTRIQGYASAAPTITTHKTGVYEVAFSGLSPATTEGQVHAVYINGTIGGTAIPEWVESILIKSSKSDIRSEMDTNSTKLTEASESAQIAANNLQA